MSLTKFNQIKMNFRTRITKLRKIAPNSYHTFTYSFLVFEPDHEDSEYKKIYEEYRGLVDMMLCSYREDLNITPAQFTGACQSGRDKGRNVSQVQCQALNILDQWQKVFYSSDTHSNFALVAWRTTSGSVALAVSW